MDTKDEARVSSADTQNNGVIITFEDGRLAFYSAALLSTVFPQAEALYGTAEDAEDDRNATRSR